MKEVKKNIYTLLKKKSVLLNIRPSDYETFTILEELKPFTICYYSTYRS